MKDYIEILSFFGYDMDKAQDYIDDTYKINRSVIEEILTEVGLENGVPVL